MKIIKIAFENINNLKGEHSVDFSAEPLASAGLFAIIGPTGSGKSTLLDVITLALFNRVPRFKGTLSKSGIQNLGSIMTHHTTSSYASIEYEVKGKRFTSKWSIDKARTGNLREYHMEIFDHQKDIVITDKKSEVTPKNETIIGLNYDQFVKSIILAQGEFSKFLKADKNERGQLLEKITGATIYRKIGRAAYQKNKELKEDIAREKAIIGGWETLSDEAVDNIKKENSAHEKKKTELDTIIKNLSESCKIKSELVEIEGKLESKNKAIEVLKNEQAAFQVELEKLVLHEKLGAHQSDVSLYLQAQKDHKSHEKNRQEYNDALIESQRAINDILKDAHTLTRVGVESKNLVQVVSEFENEINKLDTDLSHLKDQGSQQRQRINDKITDSRLSLSTQTKPSDAIALLESEKKSLLDSLARAQLNENSDIATNKSKLKAQQTSLQLLKDLIHGMEHLHEVSKKLKSEENKVKELEPQLKKDEELIQKTTSLLESHEKNINLLRQRKEDAIKIANLEELRPGLEDGKACPLCGSTEHPFSTHIPSDQQSTIEKELKEVSQNIKEESKTEKTLANRISTTKASISQSHDHIIALKKEHKTIQDENQKQKLRINDDQLTQTDRLIENTEAFAQRTSQLEAGIDALERYRLNKELTSEYKTLEDILTQYKTLRDQRKEKTTERDITNRCNNLLAKFNKHSSTIESNKKAISIEEKRVNQLDAEITRITTKLTPVQDEHNFTSIEEISRHLLSDEARQSIQINREQLQKRKTELATEIKSLTELKQTKSKLDTQRDRSLADSKQALTEKEKERETILSLLGANKNKLEQDKADRSKIASKQAIITKMESNLKKWDLLDNLIGSAKGDRFSNFAQGLTLQHLLALANKRLQTLSDRYLLDKPHDDDVLRVVDTYQGNTTRAVNTLSGGETFLISLALALSLSDMASKNIRLDSLFIDEGFGTLDQETLDVAMDTLERLQSESQKTVGIISHVEALKERIHVQIKLKKNAQGYSGVEVIGL